MADTNVVDVSRYQIKARLGMLTDDDGNVREVNVLSWNGGYYKVDIRKWLSSNHGDDGTMDECLPGIALSSAEIKELFKIIESRNVGVSLNAYKEDIFDETIGSETSVSLDLLQVVGTIARHATGWTRDLTITSWNGCFPVFDIRDWDPDHERYSHGATFTEKEMKEFLEMAERALFFMVFPF